MFERFTKEARAVVVGAQQQARELGHETIGTEHTLLSLLAGDNGAIRDALSNRGVDQTSVRQAIIEHVGDHSEATTIADRDAEDAAALKAIGIDLDAVRAAIEENFGAGALRLPRPAPKKRGIFGRFQTGTSHIPFSPRNKKVLELSLREAIRLKHNYIAPEHIMLGLLREGAGLAALILAEKAVDFDAVREQLTRSLNSHAA
ncbi:Clp protease [Actinoplanes sp. NBC_00393]|uniref:Clp protease N-terminal domain-containing protein n=1 Tax=Actinoplanes sp. NBC_00393 TaxID=2975953 RepID=UPI002E1BBF38